MFKKLFFFSSIILVVLIFGSCSRFKDITYLRGVGYGSDSLIKTTFNVYKVQSFDILYIRVTSIDEEASKIFNNESSSNNNATQNLSLGTSLIGYTIDINGFVDMPVLGKVYVTGLTLSEIENFLKEKVGKYLADARVMVKLLSFKVTLLGEIGNGQKTISAERANILEVFAMGGDISKYGNRHKILLLRTTPEGVITYRIDVTKDDLIASPYFYIQPNDLIYVEPMK